MAFCEKKFKLLSKRCRHSHHCPWLVSSVSRWRLDPAAMNVVAAGKAHSKTSDCGGELGYEDGLHLSGETP